MSRVLLQIDDEHGTASIVIDAEVPAGLRQPCDEVLGQLSDEQRWQMLAMLTRQVADQRAYERVCQAQGLLL